MNTPLITVDWLSQNLNKPNLILLDASPVSTVSKKKSAYVGQQIPNSRFFDLKKKFSDLEAAMPNTLPNPAAFEKACQRLGINQDSQIVVYDNLGIYTSPRVWWMFKTMGHEHVAVLDGGLPAWAASGGVVETKTTEKITRRMGNFKAAYNSDLKRELSAIVTNLDSKEAIVLDARSAGRFAGTAPEPRAGLQSGHIPNSCSLPFANVLENGQMKSKKELAAIFQELQIDERPLIFSCGSGLTACIILLAAELVLDNPMAVYDGSWTEWAQSRDEILRDEG